MSVPGVHCRQKQAFHALLRSPVLGDRISGRADMVACHGQAGQIPGGCRPAGVGNPLEYTVNLKLVAL